MPQLVDKDSIPMHDFDAHVMEENYGNMAWRRRVSLTLHSATTTRRFRRCNALLLINDKLRNVSVRSWGILCRTITKPISSFSKHNQEGSRQ